MIKEVPFSAVYQDITLEMIMRRAGFAPGTNLIGERFTLALTIDNGYRVHDQVTVTGVHYDIYGGLWLDIDRLAILGRPIKGIQYVVNSTVGHNPDDEGWWITLGHDPRGQFFKLDEFKLIE